MQLREHIYPPLLVQVKKEVTVVIHCHIKNMGAQLSAIYKDGRNVMGKPKNIN
ncbi:hypothetical protein [Pectobacterium sp. B1J-3]|uniref:hypothetical protein n=1 Tax=Pectobacterium sp. B1J-3 TaxID=3385371 RepID=UPI00390610F6